MQFWIKLPEWKAYYFYQLKLARLLAAKHDSGIIFKAINELKYIYSLKIQKLSALIKQYEGQSEITQEEVDLHLFPSSTGKFYRPVGKLGKLDG